MCGKQMRLKLNEYFQSWKVVYMAFAEYTSHCRFCHNK